MPAFPSVIDLTNLTAGQGFIVQGDTADDRAGYSVSSAGDVNGDGIDDFIIGAKFGDDGGDAAGEAYVVFGSLAGFGAAVGGRQVLDLTTLTAAQGFIIQGDVTGDQAGWSVSSAGDVNGDGIGDIIVGATGGDDGGPTAGEAYVVFGSRGTFGAAVGGRQVIDLTTLTAAQGLIIQGDSAGDNAGWSVSDAGDVNGDGIGDIIVGARFGDDGGTSAGEAYVVFGSRAGFGVDVGGRQVLDLTTLTAAQGFIIQGDASADQAGSSMSSAGDVNGDGIDDLIVGAHGGDDGGSDAGEAYVVFGSRAGFGVDVGGRQVIDLTTLTAAQGFIIQGDAALDYAGASVSSAGDVNGDGIGDIIVGARFGDDGGTDAGEAYVVFGTRAGFGAAVGGRQVLDLTTLTAAQGFIIQGDAAYDWAGFSVSSAGDVNGDGIDDLIVGARMGDDGGTDAGEAYVVFGSREGFGVAVGGRQVLDLTTLTAAQGLIIQGDSVSDFAGASVSAAGDVDGDGIDDLIVGAYNGDDGGTQAGEGYVIYGQAAETDPEFPLVIDLTTLSAADGFIIQGDTAGDQAGYSVSSAGDVNGDGIDDIIVGAVFGDDGGDSAGEAYIVFGALDGFGAAVGGRQVIDLTTLTAAQGFIIQGDMSPDQVGWSVSSAGDVNGDGIADVIVGATGGADGGTAAGEAYVVFGSLGTFGADVGGRQVIDLTTLTAAQGFIIQGDTAYDNAGWSVSDGGDVNGDGIGDIIVGARTGDDGGTSAGEAYVVFGTRDGFGVDIGGRQVLDLTTLTAAQGFIIQGDADGDYAGNSVSSAGDVNGDGLDDLIVGAWGGDDGGAQAGEAYVVFGSLGGFGADVGGRQVIDLATLTAAQGFVIQADAAGDYAGWGVSSAGDVNGDGIGDVIVGARFGDDGGAYAGEAYVVFGSLAGFGAAVGGRQVLDLTSLTAAQGFIIQGDVAEDFAGISVSSAGDVNGDGIDDIIIGANGGDDGGDLAGEAYVVFGTRDGFGVDVGGRQVLDLTTLTADQGFIIQGDSSGDQAGFSVSAAGDVDGDGIDDLIVGALLGDDGGTSAGEAYVIFGRRVAAVNEPAVITGDSAGDVTEAGGVANGTAGDPTDTGDLDSTDTDDPNDSWTAVAAGAATLGGYGTYALTAAGVWTYTLDDSHAAVQALNGAATLTDTFNAATVDGTTQLVTITINAQNDAAIITGDAAGDVTEAGGVANGTAGDASDTGDLDSTDVDNPADSWTAVAAGAATIGGYGTYALTAAGVWTYTLDDSNAAVQALNGAATLTDTFNAVTVDGTTQLVSITINAQNDAAVITGDAAGDVTEAGGVANGTAGDATDTGDLDSTDVDNPADSWTAVAAGAATLGGYGTYGLTAAGVWTYTLDDNHAAVQALNGAATLTDTFNAVTVDGTTQQVSITINAQNDAAIITGDAAGDVTEAGGVANGTAGDPTDTGDLDSTDVDNPADSWTAVAAGAATIGGYGTYGLTAAGVWTYTLDDSNAAVQALNGAATLTDTFNAATVDGTTQLVSIIINAQNDAAVITGDAAGDVTEAGGVANGTAGDPTDTGDLDSTDVDNPADSWTAVAAGAATIGGYGTYALTAAGVWTYTLDDSNAAVQALNGAATLTDTFNAATVDGTTQLVSITINAQNDAAIITGDAAGDVTEAGGVANGTAGDPTDTGDLDSTDVDNPADSWTAVAAGAATIGGYGTYGLTAAGVWTYTLDDSNAAVQALNGAATLTDTFNAATVDGTTQLVSITINAQNDAAVITGDMAGDVTEAGGVANGTAGDATDTGDLDSTDVDNPADSWTAVAAGAATLGGYGTYALTAAGVWTYTLDDSNAAVQALNGAVTLTDTFNAVTVDGTAQLVSITIHAQNDAAVITGDAAGDVTEAGGVANGTAGDPTDTGDLDSTDVDNPADSWTAVAAGAATIGGYGTYALTAAGVWTYTLDDSNAAVQALNGAATLTDTFNAATVDGTTQLVSITINAQNDAAVITGDAAGDVTEAGGLNNGTAGDPTDTGDLDSTDVDNPNDSWTAVAAGAATLGGYGTYGLSAAGVWTYTLDDNHAAVQALFGAATLTDTFNAATVDGTTQLVSITINAQNDTPTLAGFGPSVTFAENIVNATPQLLDAAVVFVDADGNFNTGTVTVSGLLAEDRIAIRNQGTAAGEIGVSGADVTYGNVVIGTFAGGVGGTFTVTLNGAATSAAVDALIQNLTYGNVSDTPTPSRTLILNVTDSEGADLGNASVPATFALLAGAANPFDGFDVGFYATPTFVDLDNDGDLDAVVGNNDGLLTAFENDGGSFTELVGAANPFDGMDIGTNVSPTFVDLDGDTDLDAVFGDTTGHLRSFANNAGTYAELVGGANPFDGFDVGDDANPVFADLDGDLDLDLVVGNNDGLVLSFRNDGGSYTELVGAANPFNGVDVGGRATPDFVDLDGDGDLDAVIGALDGTLRSFRNAAGVFTELVGAANPFNGIDVGVTSSPSFVDLDGDGDIDAVVGEYEGGMASFENTTPRGEAIVVNVTPQNDPPAGIDHTLTFNEDQVHAFSVADFSFTDAEGNQLLEVTIVDLPAAGTIYYDADGAGGNDPVAISAGATFTAADLNAGRLTYVSALNANGAGYATFTYRVRDDGGTALGGADTDPDANTITIDVTAVNDAPTSTLIANDTRTYFEGGAPVTLDVLGNGTIADIDSADFGGGSLTLAFASPLLEENLLIINNASVTATSNPASGGNVVSVNGIAIGTFSGGSGGTPFVISFNANATPAAVQMLVRALGYANSGGDNPTAGLRTIGWTLDDGDGNANGGNPTLSFNSSVNLVLTNDPPDSADFTVMIDEDETYHFDGSIFPYSDPENNPPGSLRIESLPLHGTLYFDPDGAGSTPAFEASPGLSISWASLPNLFYVPDTDFNGPDSFTFAVADSGGAVDPTPNTLTFDIEPVNDAAIITGDITGSVTEAGGVANATPGTQTDSGDLDSTDVDNPADSWTAVAAGAATLGGYGTYELSAAGVWTYTLNDNHAAVQALNGAATLTDTFNAATVDGTTQLVTITINAQNDAAIITGDAAGDVTEAGGVANGTAGDPTDTGDLGSTDVDNPADSWTAVAAGAATIGGYGTYGLSAAGVWTYTLDDNNAAVQALNGIATLTDTFNAVAVDGTTQLVSITINAQNDAAVITGDAAGDVTEAGGVANGSAGDATDTGDLDSTDVDNPNDSWTAVAAGAATIGGYGTYGLTAAGVWTYTLDDSNAAVQALNGAATLTDTFNAATVDGTTQLVTITIHAQNDAAIITGDAAGDVTEAGGLNNGTAGDPTDTGDLDSTDVDNPADSWTAVAAGAATLGGYGTYGLSAAGVWTYTLNDNHAAVQALNGAATLTDTFNAATVDGTVQLVSITINAQDDAAVAQDDAFTTDEATAIAGALFDDNGDGADGDVDGPALSVAEVNGSAANVNGQFTLASGALLTVNADGTFDYDPDGAFDFTPISGSGASNTPSQDSFTYRLTNGTIATVTITLTGLDTDDTLLGTAGADSLDGGTGADAMSAGAGDDTYVIDNAGDTIAEASGEGRDVAYASVSWALTGGSHVEVISVTSLGGTQAINLTGNALVQEIYGNAGANTLNGGGGADQLIGLGGDDSYLITDGSEQIFETAGNGRDVAYTSVSHVLGAGVHVEVFSTISLAGTAALNLTGNELAQEIYGNAGANTLNGGGGADQLIGVGGDDVYLITGGSEQIIETSGNGRDVAYASVSYVLGAGVHVEVLSTTSLAGTAALDLTGNELAQEIYGNAGANTLNGGGGADQLIGVGGDDVYFITSGAEQIIETSGNGRDVVYASVSHTLGAGVHVEVLSTTSLAGTAAINFTGNALAQEIYGNAGANILNGGGGADLLIGVGGDDTYFITSGAEQIIEAAGEGRDIAYATASHTLGAGVHVEILSAASFGSTAALNFTGNELAQEIYGNAGANTLNGGGGADYLAGFGGGDSFAFTTALGGGNVDTIADFFGDDGGDAILLDDAVFTGLTLGALDSSAFVAGTAAQDADDRIIYDANSGSLYFDADGNGAGAQILFAILEGAPALTPGDFTVI